MERVARGSSELLSCSSKVVGQAVFAASEWSHSIDGIAYGNVDGQRCRVFLSIRPKHLDDLHASLKVECRDDFQLSVTPAQRNKNWAYYQRTLLKQGRRSGGRGQCKGRSFLGRLLRDPARADGRRL